MNDADDSTRARRIELILSQIEAIPTPSPLAMKLLAVASDQDADVGEIAGLIESDPGMTARLLSMCSRSTTGLGGAITLVQRAVVMLGIDAVQAMLLSVDIHEFMTSGSPGDLDAGAPDGDQTFEPFDRIGLWRHGLATACAAEAIVEAHMDQLGAIKSSEAFVCGLLHDIGKIALDLLLPRSFARAVQIAQRRCEPLSKIERTLIGLDHSVTGKRLAERWGLPDVIRDVVWLHGRPARAIPDLPHRQIIDVVSAANDIARLMHVGASGDGAPPSPIGRIATERGLDPERIEQIALSLHQRVSQRSEQLGMDQTPPMDLLIQSLNGANRTLVQLNEILRQRSRRSSQIETMLTELRSFNESSASARSPIDTATLIVQCGQRLFEGGMVYAAIRAPDAEVWTLCSYDNQGRRRRSACVPLTLGPDLFADERRSPNRLPDEAARQIASALGQEEEELRRLNALTLHASAGGDAWLLNDWRLDRERGVIVAAWGAAMTLAFDRAQSDHLAEQLVDANSRLACAHEQLAETESYVRLGELASGAAHEMNNPLAVMSGRAQLLRDELVDPDQRSAAQAMVEAASQLSDLIEGLHFVASSPELHPRSVDLTEQLPRVIKKVRRIFAGSGVGAPPIRFVTRGPLPPAFLDIDLFSVAVEELLRNALEADESRQVELRVQTEPPDDRLIVSVLDDGAGVSAEILAHASDPFFSSKEAGRQSGMGLAKARRVVELHGGRFELLPRQGKGTEARITLEQWRRTGVRQTEPAQNDHHRLAI